MTRRLAVVYEAPADFAVATDLADRVLCDAIDWLDDSLLDSQREWIGEHPLGARLTWKSIPSRARELGIRVRGHFDGRPGMSDAQAGRRAIAYLLHTMETVDAILLIRDADGKSERRTGLHQARAVYTSAVKIVVGLAEQEREAWVISGFVPGTDAEQNALATETQTLGFNPCFKSQELTAGSDDSAKRRPKRVLLALTNGDFLREQKCWREAPLGILDERGTGNGLTDYTNEIKEIIVPLITGHLGETG